MQVLRFPCRHLACLPEANQLAPKHRILATAAALWALAIQSPAAVVEHVTLSYFPVSGTGDAQIYQSLVAHSQPKGLYATLATTDIIMQPQISLRTGPPCRIRHADFVLSYTVHLPRLTPSPHLKSAPRQDWAVFAAHLRQHEAHHRALWHACAQRYAAALRHAVKSDCAGLVRAAKAQWSAIEKICHGGNAAYDAQEEQRLLHFRFIQHALTQPEN